MTRIPRLEIDSIITKVKSELLDKKSISKNALLMNTISSVIDTSKHVFKIVPDGYFCDIPFDLFISHAFNQEKKSISYHSTLGSCFNTKNDSIGRKIDILSYSDKGTISDKTTKSIVELNIGWEESKIIVELYGNEAKLKAGAEFNKVNLQSITSADIIHFSSHSESSMTNRLGNYIVSRSDNNDPEPIYGFELKLFDLKDKLVILSSCNSGTGVQKPGTGVFSLSRDFLQAGAHTVIKSLWAVNEASTKELMVEMHRNFTNGQSIGEALAKAKRTVKAMPKYSHPYYWAGFVLEGNPHVYLDLEENCDDKEKSSEK